MKVRKGIPGAGSTLGSLKKGPGVGGKVLWEDWMTGDCRINHRDLASHSVMLTLVLQAEKMPLQEGQDLPYFLEQQIL